ncbi:MAG: hypothetical protein HGJ94_14130 [Desulfosarcina sp.]|nr:hypothetical protein [Desulfosarcina sp.]MBC2741530.1 hypothetical protein [Desulfosarcina sp.]MBC2764444.1 hypothetical protein [Desulfosarcina sp.]
MKDWGLKFLGEHGDRLVFIGLAAAFGVAFWNMDGMRAEGKAVLMLLPGMLLNKARSPKKQVKEE